MISLVSYTVRGKNRRAGGLVLWLGALCIGVVTCLCEARGDTDNCEIKLLGVFEHAFDDQGVPLITGMLDGKERKFGLDFASDWSGIWQAEASAIGEPKSLPNNIGAYYGGHRLNQILKVKELRLGGVVLENSQFLILPPDAITDPQLPPIVLGQQSFADLDLDLDPLNNRIRLLKHKNCANTPRLWHAHDYAVQDFERRFGMYQIQLTGSLDNEQERISISFDKQLSTISASAARERFDFDMTADFKTIFLHKFSTLTIGDEIKFISPTLKVLPASKGNISNSSKGNGNNDVPHSQITIGLRELLFLHLLISFSDRTIVASSIFDEIAVAKEEAEKNGTAPPDFELALARIRGWRAGFLNSVKAEQAKD